MQQKQTIQQPPTPEALKHAEPLTWAHWMLEAEDSEGGQLWTRVVYRHATRGEWQAMIMRADNTIESLRRIPNIKTRRWTKWTPYARDLMDEGRRNV